jgi:hypothetical protein
MAKRGRAHLFVTRNTWVEDEEEKLEKDRLKYLFLGDSARLLDRRARYLEGEIQNRSTRPSLLVPPEQRAHMAMQLYRDFQKSNKGMRELMGLGNSGTGMPGE